MIRRPGAWPLILLLTSATAWACSEPESEAPPTDEEASPLPLTIQSYVGQYRGQTRSATLYMSRFAHEEEADSLLGEMSETIGEGSDGFTHWPSSPTTPGFVPSAGRK